ncbi:hypothetical protein [Enterococcus sp. DIV0187]|uniref:hypothetical protein n=1 Tax=Enterococcus sp. DIV0187 TaxID=2774644 RepID=UPI003F23613F
MEFKTLKEIEAMTESDVIRYSTALMDRKLALAKAALEEETDAEAGLAEANEIREQLRLLAIARSASPNKG